MQVKTTTAILGDLFKTSQAFDKKIAGAKATKDKAQRVLMAQLIDGWTVAGIPKTQDGMKLIDKDKAEAFKILGDKIKGFEPKTLTNYVTGAKRAYVAGMEWRADAYQAEDKCGIPAFPWSTRSGTGAKAAKAKVKAPSKAEVKTVRDLNKEATEFLGDVRKLYGDKVADAVLDALMTALPKFKVVV